MKIDELMIKEKWIALDRRAVKTCSPGKKTMNKQTMKLLWMNLRGVDAYLVRESCEKLFYSLLRRKQFNEH